MRRLMTIAILLVGASSASASPILSFTGTVTSVARDTNAILGIDVGSAFWGYISAPDETASNVLTQVVFGDYTATGMMAKGIFTDPLPDVRPAVDQGTVANHLEPFSSMPNVYIVWQWFYLNDGWTDGAFHFSADGLQMLPDGRVVDAFVSWHGSLDTIREVPEPATLSLVIVGLAFARRRSLRRSI